ncbi:enoyl-CoA delta isomerase 1, peroxisomal-like [Prosopis cineraria]|uniref:enoyl-CoA delta isomerase 1, peroxisomal-like n=1 Tax=Prosopis cineraria TaxID=364024 RepID=UPI00240EEC52|nr:enoyl-CoA delta isomerase 1, peroxisomal-like [Prosopis cineraria]XP_054807876.1 enoyl-CoA delta isomerase 1, peroxisomal-like [Prosopis cineraria]XP_054807884.1 enoyl-CoA delta isomerase 1, peroxisomal-like [Prosopis cineraria]XP_054807890.1 enoyl-CoA delta isomerase 1, peroxisomal-like [Prosopis cineraria]
MCSLEKRGNIFILTLTGTDEHWLNPTLLNAIRSALRRVRCEASSSSALITTAHGKFFSNGFDIAWAQAQSFEERMVFMTSLLRSVVTDLISLPMPTISAVTGHASAAGCILALSHDYVLMRSDRGFLYMSELDIKLVLVPWVIALLKAKTGSPASRRELVMKATKVTAKHAVELGIIDSAHDNAEETMTAAVELAEGLVRRGWNGQVYAENRMAMLADVLVSIGATRTRSRL